MRKLIIVAAALAAAGIAAPVAAKPPVTPPPPPTNLGGCQNQQVITSTAIVACNGYYDGQILDNGGGNKVDDLLGQELAIKALTGSTTTPTINFGSLIPGTLGPADPKTGAQQLSFLGTNKTPITLFGDVIIGMHFGNITDPVLNPKQTGAGNVTIFYEFDLTKPTTFITLDNPQGWSGAYLYTNGSPPPPSVPEPATWAMMLVGFAGAGAALRRRRHQKALSQFA